MEISLTIGNSRGQHLVVLGNRPICQVKLLNGYSLFIDDALPLLAYIVSGKLTGSGLNE